MKRIFLVIFFVLGFSLYANPSERFTELMSWFSKNENDLISAGGEFRSELDLSRIGSGITKIYALQKNKIILLES